MHESPRTPRLPAPWGRRLLTAAAVVAILAGVAIGAHIGWFYLRSDTVGHALVQRERRDIANAGNHPSVASCSGFSDTATGPQGLVEARTIGLSAPVVAGTGDDQLDVAVGHLTGSSWPGGGGTTVLAAHDVSWFSQIDQLHGGSTVEFVTPCTTYRYRVTGHRIVQTGSPVYSSPDRSVLVLETCYPLNALWLTSQRYLVTAQLVSSVELGQKTTVRAIPPAPTVPAPAALEAQGLGLSTNDAPLGTLQLVGPADRSWQQSPGPLDDQTAALADYFAGIRSAEQGQLAWWTQLATAAPADAVPLSGATISENLQSVQPTLWIRGDQMLGAQIAATVKVSGGSEPGDYHLDVTETVHDGTLIITQWQMTPDG